MRKKTPSVNQLQYSEISYQKKKKGLNQLNFCIKGIIQIHVLVLLIEMEAKLYYSVVRKPALGSQQSKLLISD